MRGVDKMEKLLQYLGNTNYFKNFIDAYKQNEELKIVNTNDNVSILLLTHLFNKPVNLTPQTNNTWRKLRSSAFQRY